MLQARHLRRGAGRGHDRAGPLALSCHFRLLGCRALSGVGNDEFVGASGRALDELSTESRTGSDAWTLRIATPVAGHI
jgi:hypothetical protein